MDTFTVILVFICLFISVFRSLDLHGRRKFDHTVDKRITEALQRPGFEEAAKNWRVDLWRWLRMVDKHLELIFLLNAIPIVFFGTGSIATVCKPYILLTILIEATFPLGSNMLSLLVTKRLFRIEAELQGADMEFYDKYSPHR